LALREEGEILVLADNAGKEIRLPLADIDERAESMLSPMPSNVAELLTEEEFQHLISYLLTQKQEPVKAAAE
jgi:hypothetical protein